MELAGTGTDLSSLNRLVRTSLRLQYLYGNISVIPQGYFLDESADDVEQFELARLGNRAMMY